MLVNWIAGRLHDKHIHAAHILKQLEEDFAIRKALQLGLAHRHADVPPDRLSQRPIRRPREKLEALVLAQIAGSLAFRSRLGILGSRFRRTPVHWPLDAVFSLIVRTRLLLVFRCYRHRSHFHLPRTSKLVGFGCSTTPEPHTENYKTWLGD